MSRAVAAVAAGQTDHVSRRSDVGIPEMVREAIDRCLETRDLTLADVDAIVLGNMEMFEGINLVEHWMDDALGLGGKPLWKLNNGGIAMLWRGGCIIRSAFLGDIKAAFDKNPQLENLLLDDFFKAAIEKAQPSWRRVVATSVQLGLPIPVFSAALSYFDGYRNARLPANLLQAQRDYFGAHTYERTDKPRGQMFHTDWIRERKLT